ncbi:MAG: DUF4404 family protein [Acidimicrobiales bacterium]
MPETHEQLVARLKAEIENSGHGEADRATLDRLATESERRMAGAEAADENHEGLVEELRESVRRFEVSHPKLADAIGHVADALSSLGI